MLKKHTICLRFQRFLRKYGQHLKNQNRQLNLVLVQIKHWFKVAQQDQDRQWVGLLEGPEY